MFVNESYKNKSGDDFTITFIEAQVPEDATYWKFTFLVEDVESRKKLYSVLVEHKFISNKIIAKQFVFTEPLLQIYSFLDQVENGREPLTYVYPEIGWTII